jgi:hypothetical protein
MISFVAENYNPVYSLYPKTPRHKLRNKALASNLYNLIVKSLSYKYLNAQHGPAFWNSFRLFNYNNKSSKTLGLSLSYYYAHLRCLLVTKNVTKLGSCPNLSIKVPLLLLPTYKSTNNQTLLFILGYVNSYYSPTYTPQRPSKGYFGLLPPLQLYNNVNFYFFKVYEH